MIKIFFILVIFLNNMIGPLKFQNFTIDFNNSVKNITLAFNNIKSNKKGTFDFNKSQSNKNSTLDKCKNSGSKKINTLNCKNSKSQKEFILPKIFLIFEEGVFFFIKLDFNNEQLYINRKNIKYGDKNIIKYQKKLNVEKKYKWLLNDLYVEKNKFRLKIFFFEYNDNNKIIKIFYNKFNLDKDKKTISKNNNIKYNIIDSSQFYTIIKILRKNINLDDFKLHKINQNIDRMFSIYILILKDVNFFFVLKINNKKNNIDKWLIFLLDYDIKIYDFIFKKKLFFFYKLKNELKNFIMDFYNFFNYFHRKDNIIKLEVKKENDNEKIIEEKNIDVKKINDDHFDKIFKFYDKIYKKYYFCLYNEQIKLTNNYIKFLDFGITLDNRMKIYSVMNYRLYQNNNLYKISFFKNLKIEFYLENNKNEKKFYIYLLDFNQKDNNFLKITIKNEDFINNFIEKEFIIIQTKNRIFYFNLLEYINKKKQSNLFSFSLINKTIKAKSENTKLISENNKFFLLKINSLDMLVVLKNYYLNFYELNSNNDILDKYFINNIKLDYYKIYFPFLFIFSKNFIYFYRLNELFDENNFIEIKETCEHIKFNLFKENVLEFYCIQKNNSIFLTYKKNFLLFKEYHIKNEFLNFFNYISLGLVDKKKEIIEYFNNNIFNSENLNNDKKKLDSEKLIFKSINNQIIIYEKIKSKDNKFITEKDNIFYIIKVVDDYVIIVNKKNKKNNFFIYKKIKEKLILKKDYKISIDNKYFSDKIYDFKLIKNNKNLDYYISYKLVIKFKSYLNIFYIDYYNNIYSRTLNNKDIINDFDLINKRYYIKDNNYKDEMVIFKKDKFEIYNLKKNFKEKFSSIKNIFLKRKKSKSILNSIKNLMIKNKNKLVENHLDYKKDIDLNKNKIIQFFFRNDTKNIELADKSNNQREYCLIYLLKFEKKISLFNNIEILKDLNLKINDKNELINYSFPKIEDNLFKQNITQFYIKNYDLLVNSKFIHYNYENILVILEIINNLYVRFKIINKKKNKIIIEKNINSKIFILKNWKDGDKLILLYTYLNLNLIIDYFENDKIYNMKEKMIKDHEKEQIKNINLEFKFSFISNYILFYNTNKKKNLNIYLIKYCLKNKKYDLESNKIKSLFEKRKFDIKLSYLKSLKKIYYIIIYYNKKEINCYCYDESFKLTNLKIFNIKNINSIFLYKNKIYWFEDLYNVNIYKINYNFQIKFKRLYYYKKDINLKWTYENKYGDYVVELKFKNREEKDTKKIIVCSIIVGFLYFIFFTILTIMSYKYYRDKKLFIY